MTERVLDAGGADWGRHRVTGVQSLFGSSKP